MEIKRCYDTIIGASVASNQLVYSVNAASEVLGITRTAVGQNGLRVFGTASQTELFTISGTFPIINGHKYFWTIGNVTLPSGSRIQGSTTDKTTSIIASASTSTNTSFGLYIQNGVEIDVTVYPQVFDLSLYLPANIVDYIYSLESATAGAGIAKLKEWGFLIDDYYPHDTGSLESVEATAHKMVGLNQWDEEWEVGGINDSTGQNSTTSNQLRSKNYVPILPSTTYYFYVGKGTAIRVFFYDADKNFISYADTGTTTATTPSNAHYLRFRTFQAYGTTYLNDICINLSSDRNGEYEPYTSQTYDLGTDTLRGLFKLDSNNNLYADGDRKESDGTITRRYGVVDLGTLTWTYVESSKWIYARLNNSISLTYGMPNAISNIPYNMVSAQSLSANDVGWTIYAGVMYVRNTSASEADLRALVVGKTAVYELDTPTTEQSTPFTSPQIVYPDGTEEYVTSNGVPVGHETKYQL